MLGNVNSSEKKQTNGLIFYIAVFYVSILLLLYKADSECLTEHYSSLQCLVSKRQIKGARDMEELKCLVDEVQESQETQIYY